MSTSSAPLTLSVSVAAGHPTLIKLANLAIGPGRLCWVHLYIYVTLSLKQSSGTAVACFYELYTGVPLSGCEVPPSLTSDFSSPGALFGLSVGTHITQSVGLARALWQVACTGLLGSSKAPHSTDQVA